MFLLYCTSSGKETAFFQSCPVPSVRNSHYSSFNSETIESYEDNKTMVRIPKISFESFYCFFSIHDLIRDLTENFQKCSVDSSPPSYEIIYSKTL